MLALWRRLPVAIRAVVLGLLAGSAGTLPWAWLGTMNLRHLPSVPWGALLMAPYLWLYWRYASGRGWPSSTSAARREMMRARSLSPDVWGMAILAGILGIATSLDLMRLVGRLIVLPHEAAPNLGRASGVTILASFVMAALVAGIVEETAFRGYMQGPIERRHGPVAAILVVGVVFGLAHGSHSFFTLALLPFYMAVAATYGALAFITDSVLPWTFPSCHSRPRASSASCAAHPPCSPRARTPTTRPRSSRRGVRAGKEPMGGASHLRRLQVVVSTMSASPTALSSHDPSLTADSFFMVGMSAAAMAVPITATMPSFVKRLV